MGNAITNAWQEHQSAKFMIAHVTPTLACKQTVFVDLPLTAT